MAADFKISISIDDDNDDDLPEPTVATHPPLRPPQWICSSQFLKVTVSAVEKQC
jgi:hypothetical protein